MAVTQNIFKNWDIKIILEKFLYKSFEDFYSVIEMVLI